MTFLHEHGIDIQNLLMNGVPYLSRSEEKIARERELSRLDKAQIPDIKIKDHEKELQAFVARVIDIVTRWSQSTVSMLAISSLLDLLAAAPHRCLGP